MVGGGGCLLEVCSFGLRCASLEPVQRPQSSEMYRQKRIQSSPSFEKNIKKSRVQAYSRFCAEC